MTARTRWIFFAAAAAAFWLTLLLGAYPFFAVNKPVHAPVLVVEGWLDRESLSRVKDLLDSSDYRHVYTTGVVRPVSYHLKNGEALEGELREPARKEITITAAGLPGERLLMAVGRDTVLDILLTGGPKAYHVALTTPSRSIHIGSPAGYGDRDHARAWVGGMWIDGKSLHHQVRDLLLVNADGSSQRMGSTWAHQAAIKLHELGIPEDMITAKPTYGKPDGRTWTAAKNFIEFAQQEKITAIDVVTLGVHARRTRGLYRRAAHGTVDIGIISLPDRWCRPNDWWRHWYGWWKVLKEIVGAHQPYTAE